MMNNSLQFTVFDASAALRARQLQSNLLRGQDFFGLAVNYNTFSHRRQLLFIGAYFASKLGSRGGAPPTSNPGFAHMILCCYLQQFVGGVDFILCFSIVFDAFFISVVIYNTLFAMPVKLLLFTIISPPIIICS